MKNPNVKKNFVYSIMYQMLVIVLPIITTPYISRVLGAENIGVYSYTYSIAHYFMLIGMLGVKNYGNRCVAMVRGDKKKLSNCFWNIYTLQLISSFLAIILYAVYAVFLLKEYRIIAFIQILYLLVAAADISWFFFGLEEFKLTVVRNTVVKLVTVILIFVFVKTREDLWIYTLILSGGMFLGYVSLFPFLKNYICWCKPTWKQISSHIKPNVILFVPVIAVGIFNIMDKIMLGWFSSKLQVGYYENAEKMMRIPFGIITAFGTVMMPRMSNLCATGQKKEGEKLIEVSMCFTMFLACGMAFGLAGIAPTFAPVFFGKEFTASGTLLMALAPTILFLSFANVIRTQYLIPNCMDREFTISTIIGAILNVVINTCLISKLGAMGAVIGTLCAEFGVTFYQTYVVRKKLPIWNYIKIASGFLVNGILMFVLILLLGEKIEVPLLALVCQFGLGLIIYCVLSFGWLYMNGSNQAVKIILQYVHGLFCKICTRVKLFQKVKE